MLWLAWSLCAHAGPQVDARGSAALAYLQFGDLWVGDPILGSFDGRSSVDVDNRFLLTPMGELTVREGDHRLRLRVNGRTLQRAPRLGDDLSATWTVTSDGVPVDIAVRERAFVDEASWRWRPDADHAVDLRAGILPFGIASGRFLVESWPGVRARLDLGRLGGPGIEIDTRAAVRTDGSLQGALAVRRRWSAFEHLGLEVAVVRDTRGIAPLVEGDPGLLLGAFGAANQSFFAGNAPGVEAWISETYLQDADGYGIDRFLGDARTYLDLDSRATLAYGSLTFERLAGPVWIDAALVGAVGSGQVSGQRVPTGTPFVRPEADWPVTAPAERWVQPLALRAAAFDLEITWLAQPVGGFVFVQGTTGDPDVVSTTVVEEPVGAFLAADQAFLRTRLFPVNTASQGGAWTLPPGVGGHGLLAPGAGIDARLGPVGTHSQVALALAMVPSCVGCTPPDAEARRIYGVEADTLVWAEVAEGVRPVVEAGVFQPGGFFVDRTDPDRNSVGDLPTGWRVYLGLSLSWESDP